MYCYRHTTLSGTFHSSPHGKDWTVDDWKMFFFQYAILRVAVWYPDVFVLSQLHHTPCVAVCHEPLECDKASGTNESVEQPVGLNE